MLVSATRRGRREARLSRHRCGGLMITRRHFFKVTCTLYTYKALLCKKKKEEQKEISLFSLFLSKHYFALSARICLSPRQLQEQPLLVEMGKSQTRRGKKERKKRERKDASQPSLFETLNNFFSVFLSFFLSFGNWIIGFRVFDSLDFFVLLCSDIEHIVWLHLYITEGKVVAKIDDGYYPSTRQKNAERERKRIPQYDFFEEK